MFVSVRSFNFHCAIAGRAGDGEKMPRFAVGSRVRVIGGIAEYYRDQTIVVTDVILHPRGLSHLNRYRVLISDQTEDTFYEFQLGAIEAETPGNESQKASA